MAFGKFKTGTYIPRNNKCIRTKVVKYRSSWELVFCNVLDDAEIVKTWEFEQYFIKYTHLGKQRTYIVDFYVVLTNGQRYLIEIKPYGLAERSMQSKHSMNYCKWLAATNFCAKHNITFKVLTEHTLGVLSKTWLSKNSKQS